MRTKARISQGGSVVSFILVGVVLLAAAGGTMYYVSQRGGESQVGQMAENSADENEPTQTEEEDKAAEQSSDEKDENDTAILDLGEDDEADEKEQESAESDTDEQSAPAPEEETESTPEQIATTGGAGGGQELPQTGPAETVISVIALAAVAFVASVFHRSRRELARELRE